MSHTPGPWTYRPAFSSRPTWHVEAKGTIASVYGKEDNARLIAAATELLAALRELIAETENDFHHPKTGGFVLARLAVAKAEGKQ
jgi:hypothetical protein